MQAILCIIRLVTDNKTIILYNQKIKSKRSNTMLPLANMYTFLMLIIYLISQTQCNLSQLRVNVTNTVINANSTHNWTITYTTSSPRQQFTLYFPSCVTIQPTTTVSYSGTNINVTNFNTAAASITVMLPTPVTATVYIFLVNNAINCFYVSSFRNLMVYTLQDGNSSYATMEPLRYTQGSIGGCSLRFGGDTGQVQSNLSVGFKIQSQVRGSILRIMLQYPSKYYSSDLSLTWYNDPRNWPTPNSLSCTLLLNQSQISQTPASIIFTNETIFCHFSVAVTVTSNDNLILQLSGITNPVTSTIYASSSGFKMSTRDTNWNLYDMSSTCTPLPVNVASFDGIFTSTVGLTQKVNGFLYPVALNTVQNVGFRLLKNDKILMRYSQGGFTGCSGQISVDKPILGLIPLVFTQQTTSISSAKQYIMQSDKMQGNGTILFQFSFCNFSMPASTLPITFTLQFSGTTSTTPTVYDPYMQINAIFRPLVSPMSSTQASLSVPVQTMGDLSSYVFGIMIRQQLSQTPSIRIDFPALINVSDVATVATLSSCSVSIDGIGVGSRACQYLSPNSILVNFTYTNPIVNNNITITIQNIRNPSNPSSLTGFSMTTYYTSSQPLGLVQQGNSIIGPRSYTPRTIYPQIIGTDFTVYTNPTTIVLSYNTGVDIVNGSITTLTFTNGVLEMISGFSVVPATITYIVGSTYQFLLPSLPLNTSIRFTFTCRTPKQTGIYSVVSIQTKLGGQSYETTANPVTFQVTKPYLNNFTITHLNSQSYTGRRTQYNFLFTTIVPHPTQFILQITFPSGTNLLNGQSSCRIGCLSPNITDTSSGGVDRIELVVSNSASFAVVVTSIVNQREKAVSGNFVFRTMTNTVTRSYILTGVGTTTILNANLLTPAFLAVDDYYKGNISPVRIQVNVTNRLVFGDRIQLIFTSSSYLINGVVGCSQGTCSSATIDANTIKVIAYPTSTQVISTSLNLQIYGLISSATTQNTQVVPVRIQTYSSSSNLIDQGIASYSLDCQSTNISSKNCKTCTTTTTPACTTCYTPIWYLYNNDLCTNACGNQSQYETYPSSGVCTPCLVPCFTCYTATNCTKCITGFYLIADLFVCRSSCNTSGGYYVLTEQGYSSCIRCDQVGCISCPNNLCDACNASFFLLNGQCQGGCIAGTYDAGGVCLLCNAACQTCDGGTDFDCFDCAPNYFPITGGQCTNKCPTGQESLSDGTCGCIAPCSTCKGTNSSCLTCLDPSQFRFNFQCYNTQCPISTYAIGKQCYSCTSGCKRCSSTTCTQCLDNYNIFQNRCYFNCKDLGPRFVNMTIGGVMRCNQCPPGCTDCDVEYVCFACLDGYVLNGTVCKRVCELTNTCDDAPVPEPIIPLPGFISFFIWALAMILLKILMIKQLYLPYAILLGGALINFIQVIATLASVDAKMKSLTTTTTARLLQSQSLPSFYITALGLLAVAVALNYTMNLIFIWIYCKFIKPLILPRQIDKISNNVVFIFSVLTTHRFYLLAFSRLFKKPHVQVKNAEQLVVLHRILGASAIIDIVALVAGFLLAVNSVQLSILYMLGIDLILIIVFLEAVLLWIIFRPKPEEYYSQTKKYSFQENHITEEGTLYNDKEVSKVKMQSGTNQKIQVEEYNADENVDDLPTKQANMIKIAPKNQQKLVSFDDKSLNNPKTQRKDKKVMLNSNSQQKYQFADQKGSQAQGNINSQRNKNNLKISKAQNDGIDELKSDSNEIVNQRAHHSDRRTHQQSMNLGIQSGKKLQFQQQIIDQSEANETQQKRKRQDHQKSTKYKPGPRSTTMRMQSVTGMKKKKNIGNFESQVADSNVDEVDLQAIIQSKLVDRSKQKQRDTRTQADKTLSRNQQYEQISPSWFNIQNQRYDINDDKNEQ